MPKLSSSSSTAVAAATPAPVAKKATESSAPKTPKVAKTEPAAKKVVEVSTTPAAETPAPKKKASKPAAAAAPAPVVVAVESPATDAAVATTESAAASAPSSEYTEFMTKLQQVGTLISSLRSDFRSLEKKSSRDLKLANKANAKRARKQKGNRSPSGFVKPTLISVELATFLGKDAGTQMARTEVTREINTYIRANSLQDKANGRKINADTKLSSLLKLKEGEELTYFNLQRYMSPHFIKTVAPAAVVVA